MSRKAKHILGWVLTALCVVAFAVFLGCLLGWIDLFIVGMTCIIVGMTCLIVGMTCIIEYLVTA